MSRAALTLLACVIACSIHVFAQQAANATLTGTITDPNGAFVSGASISATHKATGVKRETVSNSDGLYVLSNLVPGDYELRAEAQGFTTKGTKRAVSLKVGQTVTLNVPLMISTSQSVDIILDMTPPLINNSDSLIHGIIDTREVETLPLNRRNFLELAFLIPGNSPAPNFDPTKTNSVTISSAGQLGRGGNVTIDGVDTNDDVVGGPIQNISQDAIQEFQIATNRFSAQMGRSASSVINVVTKMGTNELHGSGSFFFRDSALQGLPATFDRSLDESPPFDRQQYAFAISVPIDTDKA